MQGSGRRRAIWSAILLGYLHTRPQTTYAEKVKTQTQKGKSKTATLRNVETREHERRFFIVPEMLAPNGYVHFFNVKDDYYVVVPPDSDLTFSEVRRGFLQFVIDPIVINNAKDIETIRESVKKLLDERRKADQSISPDVYLTISRSLVAAIDDKQNENDLCAHCDRPEPREDRCDENGGREKGGRRRIGQIQKGTGGRNGVEAFGRL